MADHDEVFQRYVQLSNEFHLERLGEVLTDDVIEEYPQSGEIFVGLDNVRAVRANYPDMKPQHVDEGSVRLAATDQQWVLSPMLTPVSVRGSGTTGTAVLRVRYPDGSHWWLVHLYELRGDRICHQTMYFAPEFEPPDWRAPYRLPASDSSPGT